MNKQVLQINLNFPATLSNYLIELQHMLDGIGLLKTAATIVTEEQTSAALDFMSVQPADNAHLPFHEAKCFAQDWLLRAFLRDSIEITGLFLDECLSVCSLINLVIKGKESGDEVDRVINKLPKKFHKIHFPEKIATLEREFGIRSPLAEHVLSLNRARTCAVHRMGVVSELDIDKTDHLIVTWRVMRMVVRGKVSGREFFLDQQHLHLDEESTVTMQLVDHEKNFALGERISLTTQELYGSIITLSIFGISTIEMIEEFARTQGISPGENKYW